MSRQLTVSNEICNYHIKMEKQAKRCRKYGICNNQDASGPSTNINKSRYENLGIAMKSTPVQPSYSWNLDFGTFPMLCEQFYSVFLEERTYEDAWEIMPFCTFLHAMTTCLNAWLFNTVTFINKENRYNNEEDAMSLIQQDMLIPQPIAEYFSMINTTTMPSGNTVYVNLPDCCLPQLSIPAVGDLPRIPPGSFGSVTPDSHNAYECYVSPYITRRHIEACRDEELVYYPLPIEHLPQDATPNQNLLGYFFFVTVTNDEKQKMDMYHFPEEDNMAGRLQLVPRLMEDVNVTLSTFKQWYKMIPYHDILRKSVRYNFIYNRLYEHPDININHGVLEAESTLYSPYSFDETAATKAAIFSLRRERTNNARGLCFTIGDGLDPVGWAATINYNFTMSGRFAPLIGVNCSQLWHPTHTADMLISRLDIIDSFINASRVI